MLCKQKQSSCPSTIHINIKKHIGQQTLEECRAEEHNGKKALNLKLKDLVPSLNSVCGT